MARWRALRAFLRWAEGERLVGTMARAELARWAEAIERPREEPGFLPVGACRAILQGIEARLRPAVALGLFAGVRPWEISRLEWGSIDTADRIIRIPVGVSKTRRARVLEGLPETVWRWLPEGASGRVCPVRADELTRAAKRLAGVPWPHDALRHTFATYHVAAFADPGKTALLLGHEGSPTLLHRHYRGLARAAEGKAFWELRPR